MILLFNLLNMVGWVDWIHDGFNTRRKIDDDDVEKTPCCFISDKIQASELPSVGKSFQISLISNIFDGYHVPCLLEKDYTYFN
jgi:hypothetical protein